MARPSHVWWNSGKKAWYSTVAGKPTRVAAGDRTREQAEDAWHELRAKENAADLRDRNRVKIIFDLYLDYIAAERPDCLKKYRAVFQRFLDFHQAEPGLRVCDLTASHVQRWLHFNPGWSESTRWLHVTILITALNWASKPEQNYITRNPIAGLKRGSVGSRGQEAVVSATDYQTLEAAANPALREALFVLRQTGMRPVSLARLAAADCDFALGLIILRRHKTARKTGRPVALPMTAPVRAVLERLAAQHPEGALFRNTAGRPWTGRTLTARFCDLSRRVGLNGKVILYGLRHTVATELLAHGVPDSQVAAIMGHATPAMLYRHYGHLVIHAQQLADVLDAAVNAGAASAGPPAAPAGEPPGGPPAPAPHPLPWLL